MRNLPILLLVLLIALTSCDGKDRGHFTPQEKLEQSELSDSFFEQISYIPENYTEVRNDTILGNGFKVEIKFYSNMESSYLNEFRIDTIFYKHNYRYFSADVTVSLKDKTIYSNTFNNESLKNLIQTSSESSDRYILTDSWIELLPSELNNKAIIKLIYCEPESEICQTIRLSIINENKNIVELLENTD
jgi:hypothetical protein